MKNLHQLSAMQIRDAFIKGEISAVRIAEYFLNRIEKHNKDLGAFLTVLGPQALIHAEALDKKRAHNQPLGKLAAVPIAIKDNMHIDSELTTCASKFLKNYKAPFNSTAVDLLLKEDALLIGKTNLDEFAMGSSNENSAFFPVQNPWNLNCVPGGSSGGSAAAVAARLCPIATGSDTGGSIRQPASLCGIVGFKPTYGRVSRYGLVAFGSSLDQIGPFGSCVQDVAMSMEVLGKYCPHDATSLDLPPESYNLHKDLKKGFTIGIPWAFLENLSPEMKQNFQNAIDVMKSLGAQVVEVDLSILKYAIAVYYILATAEASTNLARFDGVRYGVRSKDAKSLEELYELSRKDGFGKEVKKRIMLGTYVLSSGYQDAYYRQALKVRSLMMDAFDKAFEMCDLIMTPVTTGGAFEKGAIQDPIEMYLQDIFTVPANLVGIPAISVPSGFDKNGLPLGVQMMGPQMCDTSVINAAYAFEKATSHSKIPGGYDN